MLPALLLLFVFVFVFLRWPLRRRARDSYSSLEIEVTPLQRLVGIAEAGCLCANLLSAQLDSLSGVALVAIPRVKCKELAGFESTRKLLESQSDTDNVFDRGFGCCSCGPLAASDLPGFFGPIATGERR